MKFVLVMLLCSNVSANSCKPFKPEFIQFEEYHQCARYGYNYSSELMKNFSKEFIDEYKAYLIFSCKEQTQT